MNRQDFLTLTRDGYDRTAAIYAERFHHHLDDKPVELAVLSAFAGLIAQGHNRQVIDVGCGSGSTTALLAERGARVSGIDLSPNMRGKDGQTRSVEKRSSSRSISVLNERQASAVLVGAGVVFFTSTGAVAITVSCCCDVDVGWRLAADGGSVQTTAASPLTWINPPPRFSRQIQWHNAVHNNLI